MEYQSFGWDFPIYALAAKETVTIKDGQAQLDDHIRFIAPEVRIGEQMLAFFTDTHLAMEFHELVSPHRDLTLFSIPDIRSFQQLLNRAGGVYRCVVFDPNAKTRIGRILEFQAVLQAVDLEIDRLQSQGDH